MKKYGKLTAVALIALLVGSMATACGGGGIDDSTEEINADMTQLYVSNYNGGFGDAWLQALKKEFEELYAERSFESDKKGVQVIIDNHKASDSALAGVKNSRNMVYFIQGEYYPSATQGLFADITDIVVEGGDNSIESRLSAGQKAYWTAHAGKYYALPRAEAVYGLTYDIDLFEEYSLYFAKDGVPTEANWGGTYKYTAMGEKATGPDGLYNTSDDGLPATYADLFVLFDRMAEKGVIPLTWTGWYYTYYLNWLQQAMAIDYEGYEQGSMLFSYNGTAKNLVQSIQENENTLFDTLTFKEPTTVTLENGYEMFNSAGRYYALKVMEKIMSNTKYYDYNNCFNGTVSHTDAQDNFLYSSFDNKPIGLLVEGSWWLGEASSTFKDMEVYGYGKKDRRFALMPLPKVDGSKLGPATYCNTEASLAFVNSNLSGEKLKLAKEFLKFAYSEKSMQDFTMYTDAALCLDYDLTDEQYENLTTFGKSLWNIHKGEGGAKVVHKTDLNPAVITQQGKLDLRGTFYTKIGGNTYNVAVDVFRKKTVTAAEFFKGISTLYSKDWWSANILL